jgi:uncharacterized protein (UPF0276 family)
MSGGERETTLMRIDERNNPGNSAMSAAQPPSPRVASALPNRSGVGLKPEHIDEILRERPALGFFEIHAENYMGAGGPPHRRLEAIRALYPLSLHGVGLSIGSPKPLDRDHLARLAALAARYQPGLFSEHLAWSSHDEGYLNDLLPLPYTQETLATVCDHIDQVQEALGRRMLLENPSTYVIFQESTIGETDFIREIARRTGCGLLLDVSNVLVSATNHSFDALAYLNEFPLDHVGEIHLAGFAEARDDAGHLVLIDAHDSPVRERVWELYRAVIERRGAVPTLVEWDNDVPKWPALLSEARRAEAAMAEVVATDSQGGRRHAIQ